MGSGTIGLALFKHEGEEDWEQLKQILDMTAEEWNAELKELNQEDEEDENKEEDEQEDAGPGEGKEVHGGTGAGRMVLLRMRSGSLISFEI